VASAGTRIVTASKDHTARIWDSINGQQIEMLNGPSPLFSVSYSADGAHVVTASLDKIARVWRAVSGPQIAVLVETDAVRSAVYSPDATRVVTASVDHAARIWDAGDLSLSVTQMLAKACARHIKGVSQSTEAEMTLIGQKIGGTRVDVCSAPALRP
jgi:WD40 repeat protein